MIELSYNLRNVRTGICFAEGFETSADAEDFAQAVVTHREDHEAVAIIEVNKTLGSEGLFSIVTPARVVRFA